MEEPLKHRYVGVLDILGFKAKLLELGASKLYKVYENSIQKANENFAAKHEVEIVHSFLRLSTFEEITTRTSHQSIDAYTSLEQPVVFSDSIILFSKDDTQDSLIELCNYASTIFKIFLIHELPIRGAITFGSCILMPDSKIFLGEAIVNAHIIEQSLDVIGIVVDPEVPSKHFDHEFTLVMTKSGPRRYLIPKFNPENSAGIYIDQLKAHFDNCQKKAPAQLQNRYKQSEEIFSIMTSGDKTCTSEADHSESKPIVLSNTIFDDIFKRATKAVPSDYFDLPISSAPSSYRERVYCYELYHQMRKLWPEGCEYALNGEVDKAGHPDFRNNRKIPDFLIHRPGFPDNFLVIEVKRSSLSESYDLDKLRDFIRYGYRRAIWLIVGENAGNTAARYVSEIENEEKIEIWVHEQSAQAAKRTFPQEAQIQCISF